MIAPEWKRICGLHVEDNGDMAAVWLAHDKDSDCVHLYDSCKFHNVLTPVISEGLNARGRNIPISWETTHQEMIDQLRESGCKLLPEGIKETDALAEAVSRDILARLQTGRFKVNARLQDWLKEIAPFRREDAKIPREGYPFMSATRHAILNLRRAKPVTRRKRSKQRYQRIALI